ncbi:MAG: hypothetical protein JSV86_17170 [Gemmatimonadota bacterium]|nr:MAG: hypothetical protein JSV86_17170 [Gemmatimonadota bacterium]
MTLQSGDNIASHPAVRNTVPLPTDYGIVARVLPGPPINVTVAEDQPSVATVTRVPLNVANVQLVAAEVVVPPASPTRKTVSIYNDSNQNMYVLLGPGPASATNFTVLLNPTDFYETSDPNFIGEINAIWAGAGAGAAQVTVESV